MALLKKIFGSKPISEEEQARRMGDRYVPQKSIMEMSEDERRQYWFQSRDLPDLDERLRRMTELANAGFVSAYATLIDTLFACADENNTQVPLDQLEYWARRAVESGNIYGHYYLGLVYETPEYLKKDYETHMEKSLQEYLKAMEVGNEAAARRLLFHWNRKFNSSQYTEEENAIAQANYRDMIEDFLTPEIERLREQDDEKTCCILGQLYFYGIMFEQNLSKARDYFKRLADAGDRFAQSMLANPLFDDDEDEEE